ncbi:hypothetical protein QC764_0029490 [Podospora pseudoanserina]|uniref:Thymidylate kinase n=1 Tax=Podospora pseudoanserina TaxID=2609844 RepID=A0ABR0IFI8_9PEZI|nr:hypothetical protein QC764_0029490 [Podospora pseudoanserina]
MATVSRQPFAPLDHTRLKTLTSLKNRQNALSNSPAKRKASEVVDADDSENVDPVLFSKRSKGAGADGTGFVKPLFKPSNFVMTKAASTPNPHGAASLPPSKLSSSSKPRTFLQPKSPASRLSTTGTPSPLTAPAGRSPTRGPKRIGILSKRRHTQRIDPPSFGLGAGSSVPFSLDAALKGSIPAYSGSLRTSAAPVPAAAPASSDSFLLSTGGMQSSWFFDIHEDTPEQEMTNLLQHGTCTLDISSDEESERRQSRDRAEGRDKENIPPADDISQTSARQAARVGDVDDMIIEKQRGALVEMNAADYYAEGCTKDSVVLVPWDEEEAETVVGDNDQYQHQHQHQHHVLPEQGEQQSYGGEQRQKRTTIADVESINVDDIMGNSDGTSLKAAVLGPMEGTGESFELWESTSAKEEGDAPASPLPMADESHENRVVEVECVA